jgi:hypothetical protein
LCLSSLLALNYYWHGLFTGVHSEKPADVGEGIEHILNRKQEGLLDEFIDHLEKLLFHEVLLCIGDYGKNIWGHRDLIPGEYVKC